MALHSGAGSFGSSLCCDELGMTRSWRHRATIAAAVVLGLTTAAFGCGTPPSAGPSPSPLAGLTGTWSGSASDSSGPGQLTWQIEQTGTSFSGTLTMTDTHAGYSGRGSISGTLSGSSVSFLMLVPAGGFDDPYTECSVDISGDGQVASSSISASYSGSNSCSGAITAGQLTLGRQ